MGLFFAKQYIAFYPPNKVTLASSSSKVEEYIAKNPAFETDHVPELKNSSILSSAEKTLCK